LTVHEPKQPLETVELRSAEIEPAGDSQAMGPFLLIVSALGTLKGSCQRLRGCMSEPSFAIEAKILECSIQRPAHLPLFGQQQQQEEAQVA